MVEAKEFNRTKAKWLKSVYIEVNKPAGSGSRWRFSSGSCFEGTVSQYFRLFKFFLIHDQFPHMKRGKCSLFAYDTRKVYTFRSMKLGKYTLSMFHNAKSIHFPQYDTRKCTSGHNTESVHFLHVKSKKWGLSEAWHAESVNFPRLLRVIWRGGTVSSFQSTEWA